MGADVFEVKGMTCGHCVQAVKDEVSKLGGVERVDVELDSGRVTVQSRQPVDREALRSAVEEAGYELVA